MNIKNLPCFAHVNWAPTRTDLRKFSISMIVGFGLIGGLVAWRNGGLVWAAVPFWALGVGLATAAMLPGAGRFVFVAVYLATGALGYVISRVLLTGMFFLVFTPIGMLLRMTGKDLLKLRRRPGETLWSPHAANRHRSSYYRQF